MKTLGKDVISAISFMNGFAGILNSDHKCGIIDTDGNIVVKMEYDMLFNFNEDGYAVVGKNNDNNVTYSVINTKGEKLFSFNSDKFSSVVSSFRNGSMAVVKDDKIVYLDSEGKQMMKAGEVKGDFRNYGFYNGHTIYANDEGSFGVKNENGEVIIKAKYNDLKPNYDGTFLAKKDDKFTLINAEGKQLINDEFNEIIRINSDRFIVKEGNSYSIINKEGKEIGTETFSDFSYDIYNSYANSDAPANSPGSYSNDSPTGDISNDAKSYLERYLGIMESVTNKDEVKSAEEEMHNLQQEFLNYYQAKGDEVLQSFNQAVNVIANDPEIQDRMMRANERITQIMKNATYEAPAANDNSEYDTKIEVEDVANAAKDNTEAAVNAAKAAAEAVINAARAKAADY